jgi:predicted peroxiredoxin
MDAMKLDPSLLEVPDRWTVPGLAVLLLHSTDEPDFAVAGVRAAHAAAAADIDTFRLRRKTVLVLDAEGVRLAAKGVLGALSTGGRPDLVALVAQFVAREGVILVLETAWRERGFDDDVLVDGAAIAPDATLARIAAANYAFASY